MNWQIVLAFMAGISTTLSPCVIPVIPLVIGGASRSSHLGPLYLLFGFICSFTLTGTFAVMLLFKLGLPLEILSKSAAILLVFVGGFLLFPSLDELLKKITNRTSDLGTRLTQKLDLSNIWGQFAMGTLIGLIWAPCTGPTLGAAISLASQGENLLQSFLVMLSFSFGACFPLSIYGVIANSWAKQRWRMSTLGTKLRKIIAILFMIIGLSILFGWQKTFEAWVLSKLPDWWVEILNKY